MEQGSWTIIDGSTGTKVIAGTHYTEDVKCRAYADTPGELVSFSPTFDASPAVLHVVSSENDSTWVTSHIDSGSTNRQGEPTTSQMGVSLGRSYENCTHDPEYIDYIAIDTGNGTNNSVEYDAVIGAGTGSGSTSCCTTTGYAVSYNTGAFTDAPEVTVVGQMEKTEEMKLGHQLIPARPAARQPITVRLTRMDQVLTELTLTSMWPLLLLMPIQERLKDI